MRLEPREQPEHRALPGRREPPVRRALKDRQGQLDLSELRVTPIQFR